MNEKKKKSLIALKKARSSLEKIISMVEDDRDCSEIVAQNLAVMGLLKSSNIKLLEAFIESCDAGDLEKKQEKMFHILQLLQK